MRMKSIMLILRKSNSIYIASYLYSSIDLDLSSAEWTVWGINLSFYPLHYAVIMEQVVTGRLTNNCSRCEVIDTDCAAVLIHLVLRLAILHLFKLLGDQSNHLLFVLLGEASLGFWILHARRNHINIDIIYLGGLDSPNYGRNKGHATAQKPKTYNYPH